MNDLKDWLLLGGSAMVIFSPIAVALWKLILQPQNALREDLKRIRDERDSEARLRVDTRTELLGEIDRLEKKHDGLVAERNKALSERDAEMQKLRESITSREAQIAEQLAGRDATIEEFRGQVTAILRLRQSDAIQKEALWQKSRTTQLALDSVQGQLSSLTVELSTIDDKHVKTIEDMNEKMDKRYSRMQQQLDENTQATEKALAMVEHVRKFLIEIPGINEGLIEDILLGKVIWEDVRPTVLRAVGVHDTGPLDPANLPDNPPDAASVVQPAEVLSTAQSSADVKEPTEVPK